MNINAAFDAIGPHEAMNEMSEEMSFAAVKSPDNYGNRIPQSMIDPFNKPDIVGSNTISRLDNQKKTFYKHSNYNPNNQRNT